MPTVTRLVTLTDVQPAADGATASVSARLEAELADGRRMVLLDDRGWSTSLRGAGADDPDPWAYTSAEEIAETARVVVGPDEPYGDRTRADMEEGHWHTLAETLRGQGVAVSASELAQLPHDVVVSDALAARLRP